MSIPLGLSLKIRAMIHVAAEPIPAGTPATELADLTTNPLGAIVFLGGCSASFVSSEGLVITNHHCVVDVLQEHATPEANLLRDGCTKGDPRGCVQLGGLFHKGGLVPKDLIRASGLFREGCEMGSMAGCSRATTRSRRRPTSMVSDVSRSPRLSSSLASERESRGSGCMITVFGSQFSVYID